MQSRIIKYLTQVLKNKEKERRKRSLKRDREEYINNGCIPWSRGYNVFKTEVISKSINDKNLIELINKNELPNDFGYRLDERVIEYPWILAKLPKTKIKVLDAGSTFNFDYIVNHPLIENKDLTIFTFAPEANNFCDKKISYVYGDLRKMVFKDNAFDFVISQSTIEHIDMDNSMYGYELSFNKDTTRKSYEYIIAVKEMIRVLNTNGTLLLTFPFGKFENHNFFQQLDSEMVNKILNLFKNLGTHEVTFFQYKNDSWNFSNINDVSDLESFNPHTGKGKKDDFAAHSRAIACIEFKKN